MKNICFTGHRNVRVTQELKNRLYQTLETLIQSGAENFCAGGSRGWDMLCEETVLNLREKYPRVKLHIILPYPEAEFTEKWSDEDRERNRRILSEADLCTVCGGKDGMKLRNQMLTENADRCICFFNEDRPRSGTGQTVRMAREKQIVIINLFYLPK